MASLESAIHEILDRNTGTFGIAAWDSVDGAEFLLNAHEVFPSASVIKVPILLELFWQRDEGRLSLDDTIVLRDEEKVAGSGILKELRAGLAFTLADLAILMTVLSDNTATNMLIERIGADPVTTRMRSLGLDKTTLARKMYDWEQARLGKENLCTPFEIMLLLRRIVSGEIPGRTTSQEIVDIMARQQYRDKIPLLLPEGLRIANKTGSITGVTHDAAAVYADRGPYVLCVMAKDIDDREDQRIAKFAIAEISKAVYDHFRP